ncbi:MAG: hypothetical protein JXM69_06345 [Anaerolineae bacterium]|nr:hypothetical protein [Anaerolineae bacterium]
MIRKNEQTIIGFIFMVLLMGLLAWAALPAPVVEAGLPVRETPTPIPAPPASGGDKKDNKPLGAWIEVQVSSAPAGAWSAVQWHSPSDGRSAGGWENVAGWQGPLPQNTRWWVAEKDFGDGPFRWVVTRGPGGAELGASQPFNLPGGANETVRVTVLLTR